MHVDRARHTAHEVIRVRVLAAQNRVDLDDFLLEVKHLKVVRHGKKVHGRRQFHLRVAPVAVFKDTELAGSYELL